MTTSLLAATLSNAINNLPSLRPIFHRFRQVMENPGSSAQHIVDIVKLDPVITAKVLRLANSAYIGVPHTTYSLKNAVVLLGLKRVFSIALASDVLDTLQKKKMLPFSLRDFWRHSVTVAMVAESISKFLRRSDSIDSDEAFTAGLLHDIGKLVLGCFGAEHFVEAEKKSQRDKIPFYSAEKPQMSHTATGGFLARKWNFPVDLCDAIEYHHDPVNRVSAKRMVSIVHLSDGIVHIVNVSETSEAPPPLNPDVIAAVHVQPERLRVIADEALRNGSKIEAFIESIL